jgi:hypothetical protein
MAIRQRLQRMTRICDMASPWTLPKLIHAGQNDTDARSIGSRDVDVNHDWTPHVGRLPTLCVGRKPYRMRSSTNTLTCQTGFDVAQSRLSNHILGRLKLCDIPSHPSHQLVYAPPA